MHLATVLANQGEVDRAQKYYNHALKLDVNSISANYGLGMVLYKHGNNKEDSVAHFERIITNDPAHYKALTQLGVIYLEQNDIEKAADIIKRSIKVNKNYPLSLVTFGNLCFELGESEKAIRYYQRALRLNENDIKAFTGLANAYYDI